MPSPLPPIGFWSYSREDDRRADGKLSQLRALLAKELEGLYGRYAGVRLHQDLSVIEYGNLWAAKIEEALSQCSFMIAIVTPDFFQSEWCCKEVRLFEAREKALGRSGLIFPIEYISVARMDRMRAHDPEVWDRMSKTQMVKFSDWRHYPPDTTLEIKLLLADLAQSIADKLSEVVEEPDLVVQTVPEHNRAIDLSEPIKATALDLSLSQTTVPSESLQPSTLCDSQPIVNSLLVIEPEKDTAVQGVLPPSTTFLQPANAHRGWRMWATSVVALLIVLGVGAFFFGADGDIAKALAFIKGLDRGSGTSAVQTPIAPTPSRPLPGPARESLPVFAATPQVPTPPPAPAVAVRDCADCPEMVLVPAGKFTRGVAPDEEDRESVPYVYRRNAQPIREVTIGAAFYMGKYAVSVAEFRQFARATGVRPKGCRVYEKAGDGSYSWAENSDRDWEHPGFPQTDRHPVVCVSQEDAVAYSTWLTNITHESYRLPSEMEWEYAARAGTTTARYWGNGRDAACLFANVADATLAKEWGVVKPNSEQYFSCSDRFPFTAPSGSFNPNAFGLYDMLGNVQQWTADTWHQSYDGAPLDGSAWTATATDRVRALRGKSLYGSLPLVRVSMHIGNRTEDPALPSVIPTYPDHVARGASWANLPWLVRSGARSRDSGRSTITGFRLVRKI